MIKTGSAPDPISRAHGDFENWFLEGLNLGPSDVQVVDVQAGQRLPDLADSLAGVLVTGSPAMVSHREDWSERTAGWLANAHYTGLPMLGVCYGHQLIAHALGGRVGPNPAGRRMGTHTIQFHRPTSDLFDALPKSTQLHATHVEAVLELPSQARVIGTTDGDPHHVLHFGQRSWGVQFHPEFTADIMASYIRLRADELRAEGQSPDELLAGLQETPAGFELLRAFVRTLVDSGVGANSPAALAATRS